MKKLLSLLLVLCMSVSLLSGLSFAASVIASGKCGLNLTWTLDSTGTLIISGTGPSGYPEVPKPSRPGEDNDISDPWAYNRYYDNETSSITNVVIKNGVTSIDDTIFLCCDKIKSITIPSSVTRIDEGAFWWCERLTDVYYLGGEEDWQNILVGSNNEELTSATIHYIKTSFESLFLESSYRYNHELARLSLQFAKAGFSAKTDNFTVGDGDQSAVAKSRYANMKAKYDENGFKDNQKFYNYGVALTDTSDKAAYSMASKDITIDGKKKKLVALVVRGGGYGGEWVSNFNVGSDATYSQGFKKPADDITKKLKSYISAYKSNGVLLWITGYSRGAAIANLVAANMIDYSGNCSYLNMDDIFAYTFATPSPIHRKNGNVGNSKYNNIFNIVNPIDPVPCVLLSDWGYGRYGTTKYIRSAVPSKVKNQYKKITGDTYPISQDQRSAVDALVNILSNIADTKPEYYRTYAEPIKDIVHWLMVSKEVDKNATLMEYAITKYAKGDVGRCYMRASGDVDAYKNILKKAGCTQEYLNLAKEIGMILELNGISMDEFLSDLLGKNLLSPLKTVLKAISIYSSLDGKYKGLGTAHTPEVYEAWLFGEANPDEIYPREITPDELLNENANKYKMQLIQCPVDVEVRDRYGNIVVSVVNHEILIDEIPVVVIDDKIKIFYYDDFDDYIVEITAYEDGEVNYYISEYANGESETKRVCYTDIKLCESETIIGVVNDEVDTDVSNYNLITVNNDIDCSQILTEEELENLSVTVHTEGSGTATEITDASKGDYVTMSATPNVGAEFIGWYQEDTCMSQQETYSFVIEENCSLTAKFTVATAEILNISTPTIKDSLISCCVDVVANSDVEGVLVFNTYADNNCVDEYTCEVSMRAGETQSFTSALEEDGASDYISVYLHDKNGVVKTRELTAQIVRELQKCENSEYQYTIYPDETIEITRFNVPVGEIVEIPNEIDDYPVFALGENLFEDNNVVKEIRIPETVSSIKSSVFSACKELTKITVSEDNQHFSSLDGSLYSKNQTILIWCAIEDAETIFSIPETVTSIETNAFAGCKSLEELNIPDSVVDIGDNVFKCNDLLTDVYYSGSEEDWKAVAIGIDNDLLMNAIVHYGILPADVDLATINGAQIRTTGNQGLRFISLIEKTSMDFSRVVEYGTVLIPTADITDISELQIGAVLNGHTVAKVQSKKLYEVTDTTIKFTAVLTDIQEKNYAREYTARAYAILDDGSVVYADSGASRSIYTVAKRGLENESQTEENKAIFQGIVDVVEQQ